MAGDDGLFIWGDNWWIEGDKAWFVWAMENILFCINLDTNRCEAAVCIPDKNPHTFRLTPYCVKSGNKVFCMPNLGKCIWIYDLECQKFTALNIDNPKKVRFAFDFWMYAGKLWAVSSGDYGRILEININQEKIENYYTICEDDKLAKSTMVKDSIYTLTLDSNKIYEFNLRTKEKFVHILPEVRGRLWTICYSGEKFWMSGFQREIYVWDKQTNTLDKLTNFPEMFGVYDFTKETTTGEADCISKQYAYDIFHFSVAIGNKVWFIPYNANKIVYVAEGTDKLCAFEIYEENETRQSIIARTSLGYKYLLEYVKDDRYLGLFSIKNNCILEIDTLEMRYVYRQYSYCDDISATFLEECADRRNGIFKERIPWDRKVYRGLMDVQFCKNERKSANNVGNKIYKHIVENIDKK